MPESPLSRVKDCPHPPTQKGMVQRACDMIMLWESGDYPAVLAWLRRLGCKVEEMERSNGKPVSWAIDGIAGVHCGLSTGLAPLDMVPVVGFILAGPFWPQIFPTLGAIVGKALKERKHGNKTVETAAAAPLDTPASTPLLPRRLRDT